MNAFARDLLLLSLLAVANPAAGQGVLNRLEDRLNDLLAPPGNLPPSAEAYRRQRQAYLGLSVEDDDDFRTVVVTGVQAGSPAARAGFRVDDEIIGVAGRNVRRMNEVTAILDQLAPGTQVEFEIRRDGARQRMQVTLAQRPVFGIAPVPYSQPYPNPAPSPYAPRYDYTVPPNTPLGANPGYVPPGAAMGEARPSLGITVAPISDEARDLYGLVVRRGALITAVRAGGLGEKMGLRVGDVIVAYEGQRIESADDLINTIRAARVGDEIELSYYRADQMHRQRVRLVAAMATDPTANEFRGRPAGEPPLVIRPNRDPAVGSPSLEQLERNLESVPRSVPAEIPSVDASEVVRLRSQVDQLQKQLLDLQKRLEQLEAGEKKN